jgi:hypothetical protein
MTPVELTFLEVFSNKIIPNGCEIVDVCASADFLQLISNRKIEAENRQSTPELNSSFFILR